MNTKQIENKSQENLVNSSPIVNNPKVFLSRDGNYLVHDIAGMRILKHVNFYKKVLGVAFTPISKPSSKSSLQIA